MIKKYSIEAFLFGYFCACYYKDWLINISALLLSKETNLCFIKNLIITSLSTSYLSFYGKICIKMKGV